MSAPSLDELLEFALAIAREAGQLTLGYFQRGVAVERKADATPVTIADREAEQLLPIILEEAGGHFVTWEGHRYIRGGSGIATNAALHDEVLRVMRG